MRFGSHAQQYREHARIQREVAQWCGEWLDARGAGLSALELGAGSGLFTELLVDKGFDSLIATDLSQRMIEEGRRCVPRAEWRQQDAWQEMPSGFDRLYAISLLQWADEPLRALRHWRQALKPAGRALVGLFVQGSLQEFTGFDNRFSPVPLRSAEEWLALFREAGFDIARHDALRRVYHYESSRAALRSLHNTGAVIRRRTPPGQLRALLAQQDATHRTERGFPLTWVALKTELIAE